MDSKFLNDYLTNQIKVKKDELDKKRESFDIAVQNELYSDSRNFEGNAIAVLTSMAKLKSEIETLEQINLLLAATTT